MEVTDYDIEKFFEFLYGDEKGFVYMPTNLAGTHIFTKHVLHYPRQLSQMITLIRRGNATKTNTFYTPALLERSEVSKENVKLSNVLWVDFDGNAPTIWPEHGVPTPSLRIQSSLVGHEHCYWRLNTPITDVSVLEERNRALTYTLSGDAGGWDSIQILRPLGSMNFKRNRMVVGK